MKTFRQFLFEDSKIEKLHKRHKRNRSDHLAWNADELEHHGIVDHEPVSLRELEDSDDALPTTYLSKEQNEQFAKDHAKLKPKHHEAIANYKKESKMFNRHLRNEQPIKSLPPKHKAQVKLLDHVTSKQIDHPITVYRGTSKKHQKVHFHTLPVGHEFTDNGYTGTTLNPGVANKFVAEPSKKNADDVRTILKIHLPAGTRAHYMDHETADHKNNAEQEMLLHRGSRFRVTKQERINHPVYGDTHVTHMEVIHQPNHDEKPVQPPKTTK